MPEVTKSELSPGRRRLVDLMHGIGFGEILNLTVSAGEPLFDPAPEVIREVRLGPRGDAGWRAPSGDFVLTVQVTDLFHQLDVLHSGTIEALEIQAGLPFRLRLRGRLTDTASKHLRQGGPGR